MEQMAGGKRPSPSYPSRVLGRGSRFWRALGRVDRLRAGFLRAARNFAARDARARLRAAQRASAPLPRRLAPPSATYRPDAADPP